MGIPALFRWLSKKYPKIISYVVEEEDIKVPDAQGVEISIPVNISGPNPNGYEFDNLYLDMNGIVHPCTHPEGRPPPETEGEMMVEIFNYTERVVNMVRPRKVLFLAIDGVAPRAKMNEQRSRRFRSARDAQDKADAREEAVAMWESMGKELNEDEKTKKAWDQNAITPGTPFMELLAVSLRYWVAQKLNSDPGWKGVQVHVSDASVPGEGEHKIMDFIRRQRSNPGHDPNTKHVIYGLDADFIMLALASHEPHFRVLREDVFFQDTAPGACRICGQEGHYAAQCTGTKADIKKEPSKPKPFIFLDVSVLREYLEVELHVTNTLFPFNLEQAIDDWVLLIFFVGNDFLPHLPSLEIREGAIDTLLKIWKDELPRMGGYVTNHGHLELARAEIILNGLARREDEIFRRRREGEERQDHNAKRRKIEMHNQNEVSNGSNWTPLSSRTQASGHSSLSARPGLAANADSIGLGGPRTSDAAQNTSVASQALAGSNRDIVANRGAIRMANMSAAEVLEAELGGLQIVRPFASASPSKSKPPPTPVFAQPGSEDDMDVPGFGNASVMDIAPLPEKSGSKVEGFMGPPTDVEMGSGDEALHGLKRKIDETEDTEGTPDVTRGEEPGKNPLSLKVNPDGTVDQEDTVKLWEPGYRERYYQHKFGVEYHKDPEFKKKLTTAYIEGIAWVLHYYYQGTPSWQWYYPYHFAPFANDFEEVNKMDITFVLGQPFKPFEQLMGVLPPASRQHIPEVFHPLMLESDSPIIDFYTSSFEIDMNGKKMSWQGVVLLPFIDQKRLLNAMKPGYSKLTEHEIHRNKWGKSILFISDENSLYPSVEALYGKRRNQEPVLIDVKVSKGISGSLLPNPDCIPGSTYRCPLTEQGLADIPKDRSLSALYVFPKQLTPHRSIMLPGVKRSARVLTANDLETTRRGIRGHGYGGGGGRGNSNRGGGGYGGYNERGGGHSNGSDSNYGGAKDPYRENPPSGNASHQQYPPSGNSYQRPPQSGYSQLGQGNRPPLSYAHDQQRQPHQPLNSYDGPPPVNYYGRGPPLRRGRDYGHEAGYSNNNRGSYGGDQSGGYGGSASYGGPPPAANGAYPARRGYGRGGEHRGHTSPCSDGYPLNAPAYNTGFESYSRGNDGNRGRGRGGRY